MKIDRFSVEFLGVCLCGFLVFFILATAVHDAKAAESPCERFWDWTRPVKPLPVKIHTVKVSGRFRTFRAWVAHLRRKKNYFQVGYSKRIRPRVTWGSYYFDKSAAILRSPSQKQLAFSLAQSLELRHLNDPFEAWLDIENHTRLARSERCYQRKGLNITAFPVYVRVP